MISSIYLCVYLPIYINAYMIRTPTSTHRVDKRVRSYAFSANVWSLQAKGVVSKPPSPKTPEDNGWGLCGEELIRPILKLRIWNFRALTQSDS